MSVPSTSVARCVLFVSLLGLVGAAPLVAELFRVGVGTGCTHATLDLALAAATANGPGEDSIFLIPSSVTLSGLAEISDQTVYIAGGFSSCEAVSQTGRTTIHRDGPTDAFFVHGTTTTDLTLDRIDLVMGPSALRGLTIDGPGETNVHLQQSSVTEGQAFEGGNIWIAGATSVLFVIDSEISFGSATTSNGGGIYCESGAEVSLDQGTELFSNFAFGSGGGIYADDCHVGMSSGWDGVPGGPIGEIYSNSAGLGNGGAIAAVGGATVILLGSEPGQYVSLRDNEAPNGSGGGIWIDGADTQAVIWNSRIEGNHSQLNGGGVRVGNGAHLQMEINPASCWPGRGCSRLLDNHADEGNGGGVAVLPGGSATILRTEIHGNYTGGTGEGAAASVTGAGATLLIEGCEIYDNDPDGAPGGAESSRLFAGPFGSLTLAFSTAVEDVVGPGTEVLLNVSATSMRLLSSIVHASKTMTWQSATNEVDCVVVSETVSLPGDSTGVAMVTDPALLFHLATSADFRLLRDAVPEDFCDTTVYIPVTTDIDGQVRGFDDFPINVYGTYDLGADEWSAEIFAADFEAGGLLGWTAVSP